MSETDISLGAHVRAAQALLAVEAGDATEVREAMRKIIASAPEAMDVALVLSLALARAGDGALRSAEPNLLLSPEGVRAQLSQRSSMTSSSHEAMPSRWWAAAAAPLLGLAALLWWLGHLVFQTPDPGTDAAEMALPMFMISVGSLGAALMGVETLFLLRWHARGSLGETV